MRRLLLEGDSRRDEPCCSRGRPRSLAGANAAVDVATGAALVVDQSTSRPVDPSAWPTQRDAALDVPSSAPAQSLA